MRFAVLVFPGSNCDIDCEKAIQKVLGEPIDFVWHTQRNLDDYDAIIVPGGFSYGDYLRAGALARFSPVMEGVVKAATEGKLVLGICNGFQILQEAGLLPGAMRMNDHLKFRCDIQPLTVVNNSLPFTQDYQMNETIRLPIAHGQGNFYCDEATHYELTQKGQIVFRYQGDNPNGSVDDIAGVCNQAGNVLGLMPHPERAIVEWMGSQDGGKMFTSMLRYWEEKIGAA
ncbi:phosphoribosylformylglycinamidine synthase subunit PurQ [Marininema halotolerans]|uniref:Phosphoribosylformylglycinamidine synthase subunit PurQ n=1 Tax=Marininema halotolerans TaxID=1155944 RepID=A0A1I6SEA8_9BACL|nr:phosphoribosylformylglycinamidine synthase subunit PurQ [Marininema halotolerans]SFS75301.1 phosphoribosylformylglycinamidine synthase [Marininema halotolerans]